ncbi:MAG: prepilin-type N-terminal cleavage/methylation domain-containing protein [Planctomycetota bacterium]
MNQRPARGYTLVEILIGVFIMAIGIVSILGAFPLGIRIVAKIKRTTMLCNFAVSKLAEYQAYASPGDTLCAGENTNPYAIMRADNLHATPGIAGDCAPYDENGVNGVPNSGDNGGLEIRGAGKNLHWKMADFEHYVKNQGTLYDLFYKETDYRDDVGQGITSSAYRMGLTQNNQRHQEAYGFTRKYIIEVWCGGTKTKTDPRGLNEAPAILDAYYAFSTAIWDPHIVHSTEWSPVMETNAYQSVDNGGRCVGKHDYFWPWNNRLEGWGFRESGAINDMYNDKGMSTYPSWPLGGDDPWL